MDPGGWSSRTVNFLHSMIVQPGRILGHNVVVTEKAPSRKVSTGPGRDIL